MCKAKCIRLNDVHNNTSLKWLHYATNYYNVCYIMLLMFGHVLIYEV